MMLQRYANICKFANTKLYKYKTDSYIYIICVE